MEENQCTKHLAKNQDCAIFHERDTQKNVLPKFTKLCMETPLNMAAVNKMTYLSLSFFIKALIHRLRNS